MPDHILAAEPGSYGVATDAAPAVPAAPPAPLAYADAARGLAAASLILSWRLDEHARHGEAGCKADVVLGRHSRLREAVAQFDAATGCPATPPAEVAALRDLAGQVLAAPTRDDLLDFARRLNRAATAARAATHAA